MMLTLAYVVIFLIGNSLGYPNGAPTKSCDSMFPVHGHHEQSDPCPFVTQPQESSILSNSSLEIILHSLSDGSEDEFKGYMIMAFNKDDLEGPPLGYFQVASGSRTINCNGGIQNAATHSSRSRKSSVQLNWIPPLYFDGEVVFKTTFVSKKSIFWVQEVSSPVRVTHPESKLPEDVICCRGIVRELGGEAGWRISLNADNELYIIWFLYSLFIVLMIILIWYGTYVVRKLKTTVPNTNPYVKLQS